MRAVKIACKGATTVDINDLIEFQGNLKSLSKENYGRLKSQILELDFSEPISVWIDKDGKRNILNGHQRLRTLKMMRDEGHEVPPIPINLVEASSKFQAKKKVLALASQYGEVEGQGLYEFVTQNEIPLDVLDDLRLPEIDMDDWKDEYINEPTEGLTDDDAIPEQPEALCKTGDIWQLGEHRLMCGDSTDKAQVERLMNGEKADMVFTDPPYGMNLDTDYSKMPRGGSAYKKVYGDDKDFDPQSIFFVDCSRYCIWGADWFYKRLPEGFSPIVWDKQPGHTVAGPQNHFELCWVKPTEKRRIIRKLWTGFTAKEKDEDRVHPTQKPIDVCVDLMERGGTNVYDPFGGSGSTLIACEKTKRKCFMMEIDPHYCDIIIARWQNFTGKTAKKC